MVVEYNGCFKIVRPITSKLITTIQDCEDHCKAHISEIGYLMIAVVIQYISIILSFELNTKFKLINILILNSQKIHIYNVSTFLVILAIIDQ